MNTTDYTPRGTHVETGEVISHRGTEYYVAESYRGALDLVRLNDLKDGFRANALRHGINASRPATKEERASVTAMLRAKMAATVAFQPGALVKATKAGKYLKTGALYVILKANPKSVSITELGGNTAGAYLTAGRAALEVVNPADVLK